MAVVGAVRPLIAAVAAVVAFFIFFKTVIIDHVEAEVGDFAGGAVVVVHVVVAIVKGTIVHVKIIIG